MPAGRLWSIPLAILAAIIAGLLWLGARSGTAPGTPHFTNQPALNTLHKLPSTASSTVLTPKIRFETAPNPRHVENLADSSLAGSQVDRARVSTDSQGRVIPNGGVLVYFDYFLSLQGEMALQRIMALVQQDLESNFPPAVAAQLYALFERYVAYLQAIDARLSELTTESARQQGITAQSLAAETRAEFFSPDEIDKLFGEYDRMLTFHSRAADFHEKLDSYRNTPAEYSQAMATELFGVEAAIRFQALEAKRAAWQERLHNYQSEKALIMASNSLADSDRQRAVDELRQRHFDAHEQVRVKTLEQAGM